MSGMTKSVFGQLRKKADDAVYTSEANKKRLDNLETFALGTAAFLARPLPGRLKWLLLGR
jgi:hypothetical protein